MKSKWLVTGGSVGLVALALVAALVGSVGGCSGKTASSGADNAGNMQPSQMVIGAAGGTVTSADGEASVAIPPGALSSDVAITITPLGSVTVPGVAVVGTAYQLGPSGLTFAKPVTVTVPFDASMLVAPSTAADVRIMMAEDGSAAYVALVTTAVDGSHVSATTTHFSRYVAVAPAVGAEGGAPDSGSTSTCRISCEGPDDVNGGIGCNCGVTCDGIVYQVQCVCGECTCYQDGVPGKTASVSISTCNNGASSLGQTYFNVCGYPGAKNGGSAGGPSSNDGGGSCPGM